jgi:hypothetical protein
MPLMPVILFILSTFGMTAMTHNAAQAEVHKAWTRGLEWSGVSHLSFLLSPIYNIFLLI